MVTPLHIQLGLYILRITSTWMISFAPIIWGPISTNPIFHTRITRLQSVTGHGPASTVTEVTQSGFENRSADSKPLHFSIMYFKCQEFGFCCAKLHQITGASLVSQLVKNLPARQEIHGSGRFPEEGIGYPHQYSWASLVVWTVKNTATMRDLSWILGLGRSPGGGPGNLLQYSCLKNLHGQRSLVGYSPWVAKSHT